MQVIEVDKSNLGQTHLAELPDLPLATGEVRLALRRFALTANNVTYAVFGSMMKYWAFFPASTPELGRVPVWGFADVVESRCEGIVPGERLYGYFPMADRLIVEPGKVTARGFSDMAAHRQAMAPIYNVYGRVPGSSREDEGRTALLRPLFLTGWLLDQWLSGQNWFGAQRVIAAAASSKTALAMAVCLKERTGIERVALTSERSAAFVRTTGYFDRVLTYGQETQLSDGVPSVHVDFSGNQAVTRAVHQACGEGLRRSIAVGGAHWDAHRTPEPIPGMQPELFFAPSIAAALAKQIGPDALAQQSLAALELAKADSVRWMRLQMADGLSGVPQLWRSLLDNAIGPEIGLCIEP